MLDSGNLSLEHEVAELCCYRDRPQRYLSYRERLPKRRNIVVIESNPFYVLVSMLNESKRYHPG